MRYPFYNEELNRLIDLAKKTYKIHGIHFLIKEIRRYVLHGPLIEPIVNEGSVDRFKNQTDFEKVLNNYSLLPKISIITYVGENEICNLQHLIESLISQFYRKWEFLLCLDNSLSDNDKEFVENLQKSESRIKITYKHPEKDVVLSINELIGLSNGYYIGIMNCCGQLTADSLAEFVLAINRDGYVDFLYCDDDEIDRKGKYINPHFKPDFNKTLLLSFNYINNLALVKRDIGDELNWLRPSSGDAFLYDLFIRISGKTNRIVHVPKILFHCRKSCAANIALLENNVLENFVLENNGGAEVQKGIVPKTYRIKYQIKTEHKVNIIIPFKDEIELLKPCLESLFDKTKYPNIEVILVSNNSQKDATFQFVNQIVVSDKRIRLLEYNHPFNYSAINNWAVQQSDGAYVLLLNNDTKVISDGWLEAMLEYIQQDDVGVVGAKMLYDDNTIQHAGIVIGINGVSGHAHRFLRDSDAGYFNRASVPQELSAVTGACLLTKRELWDRVGGMDEEHFGIAFNDIDYCLKIRELGLKVIYTPYAKLYHYESKSRGPEDTPEKQKRYISECNKMIERWGTNRFADPFYNVNLTLSSENFGIRKR